MYIPNSFRIDNRDALHAFMRSYSFATLVTGADQPFATHLPLLLDPDRGIHGTLIGHFARPNPHWKLDHVRQGSLAIFQGPHAYISPSWYRSGLPAVPTWNYAAVHAIGRITITDDPKRIAEVLEWTVHVFESQRPSPWVNPLPDEATQKLIASVVAFEMTIERLEGKFKLGQNRRREDQLGAIDGLEATENVGSTELANFTRTQLGFPSVK